MNNLVPMEFNSQRILTTEQLAEVYKTTERRISENFNYNKERFQEGKHFYLLQGDELKAFKDQYGNCGMVNKNASQLYLWTERGADRHCKMLGTDEAWEQFDNLEETYFKVKEAALTQLSPELQMFKQIFDSVAKQEMKQKEIEQKIEVVSHRINNLDATNIEGTSRQRLNDIIRKYAYEKGIQYNIAWKEFRTNFNTAYHTNIEQKKTNYQGKNNVKNISYPDYLERVNLIDDALRVADKMINLS